ncbi:MAG: 4Fe-4S binding protein [Clostridium argentinense]|nr:4Fe-4S binding protein [Clostridium argentinense]
MAIKISLEEKSRLKGEGFIPQRDGEHFVCRVITEDGNLNSSETKALSNIAEKYGKAYMSYTTRLTVEIPWISYEDIINVKKELKAIGLEAGGTGARVRPVVSCKGTVCLFGILDTQKFARKIHERFYKGYYNVRLPHKFKIGIGGCPNNCIKPDLNDLGMMGQKIPAYERELCKGCKNCSVENICKIGAAKIIDGKIHIDREKCINCGLCINNCHFNSIKCEKEGVKLFIGGKWGRTPRRGEMLEGIYSYNETMNIIEKTILYYREKGNPKERFGDMVARIGFEEVSKEILKDDILKRKEEILNLDCYIK